MKKVLSIIAVIILLEALAPLTWAHDGSVTLGWNQTIYYDYNSSSQTITIVMPSNGWGNYIKPTGVLVIPDSITYNGNNYPVTEIGYAAFSQCYGLTSVTIPRTVTRIDRSFWSCDGLTSVIFNADSCTYAGSYYNSRPFYGCANITSFTFGNNVKHIPAYLCYEMGLTTVTIPEGVTFIGDNAFHGCSLTSVAFNADSCIYAGSYEYGGENNSAFSGCSNITSFTFGSNVKIIPHDLCHDLSGITSVAIPNAVIHIGDRAFFFCDGLTSITIPNAVTFIGSLAFAGCNGLNSVVFYADNCTYTGVRPFHGCANITSLTFGNNVNRIPAHLCHGMSGLTTVSISDSVISIGDLAFSECSGLTSVTIPSSVTYIGSGAFSRCSGLTTVTILGAITSIESSTFERCTALTSVTIPDAVTLIDSNAFYGCSSLHSFTIPNAVNSIGSSAFFNCTGLASITIPDAVDSIGNSAFKRCDNLRSITVHSEMPAVLGSNVFSNTPSDKVFYIPCGTTSAYNSAWGYFNYSEPVVDFEVTVLSSNTDRGTATMVTPRISCVDSSIVVRANANYHYHFVSWSNGRTANPDTLFLNSDTSVTALFAPDRYQVNVVSNDTVHGSVTGSGEYDYLDTILLTASAAEHYHFVRWNGWYTENPYQYVVTGNTTITGYFEIDRHQVVAISNDEMKGVVTGGGSYNYGSPCTLTASAYTGYQFIGWSNGQTANPYSFPVLEDMELTAMFVEEGVTSYTVTATSADLAMGTATVNGGSTATVEAGETVTLVATANEGYHFTRWNDNSTDATRTVTVTGDILYIAYFESDAVEIYTVSVSSDDPSMGTATVNGSSTATVELGEIVTLVATANEGYQFVRWNDDNTDATRTVIVTSDMSFTAYFESLEGIEDVDGNGIRVYAVNGQIVVDGIGEERILIYDIVGRNVHNESLPRGVYMVKVGDNPARKVVVIK